MALIQQLQGERKAALVWIETEAKVPSSCRVNQLGPLSLKLFYFLEQDKMVS